MSPRPCGHRLLLLSLASLLLPLPAAGQLPTGVSLPSPGSGPTASYEMDVRLDTTVRTVSGTEVLTFRNRTSRPTSELRFHAYYNAWKHDGSSWMQGRGSLPVEVDPARLGWIQVTRAEVLPNMFYTAEDLMETFAYIQPDDGNPWDQTLFRLELPRPLPPGGEVVVRIAFTSKIPRTFARTGYIGDHYFLAQWFPKAGVLTDDGWQARQYFPVEYFAPFGTYDVRLTVPSEFVVGATGELVGRPRVNADGTTTHRYRQEMVHDFAWTAWPDYLVYTELYEFLPGQRTEITLLLTPEHKGLQERYLQAVKHALHFYSDWFGPYPYTTATCVDPPYNSGAGGMEYPTFFTGGAPLFAASGVLRPEGVTIHEFGHQFWYGLVANNETDDAWMDEGFNSYSEARVQDVAYGPNHEYITVFRRPVVFAEVAIPHRWAAAPRYRQYAKDVALDVPSWRKGAAYGANAYNKAELMHWTLEGLLGWETYREVLRTYQMRWRFRHPGPADYFAVVNEVAGMDMDWFFDQVYRTADVLDYAVGEVHTRTLGRPHGAMERPPGAPEGGPPWVPEGIEVPEDLLENVVMVRRLGEVVVPVEVLVQFADGREVIERWDGRDRSVTWTLTGPAKVVGITVDPNQKLALDIDRSNNSWRREADHRGSWKLTLRWMFWLQSLLEFFAFIS